MMMTTMMSGSSAVLSSSLLLSFIVCVALHGHGTLSASAFLTGGAPTTSSSDASTIMAQITSLSSVKEFFNKPGPYGVKHYSDANSAVIEPVSADIQKPFPTVVMSKGNGALCGTSVINAYNSILTHLATHGVASVTPCSVTYVNPAGLKSTIKRITTSGFANPEKIGVAAHSLGGNSALGLFPDELNIKALALLSGVTCILNIPHCNPSGVNVPFFMVQPSLDQNSDVYGPAKSAKLYAPFAGEHNAAIYNNLPKGYLSAFFSLFLDALPSNETVIREMTAELLFGDDPASFKNDFLGARIAFPDASAVVSEASPDVSVFSIDNDDDANSTNLVLAARAYLAANPGSEGDSKPSSFLFAG